MQLHVRLALASAALLCAAALVLATQIARIAERYQAEVAQRLNAGVAMYVTQELTLINPHGVNKAALKELGHRVMTVNPSAEVYLLDLQGNIVATLIARERLRQTRVDLAPVLTFLSAPTRVPIYGDDPTNMGDARAVFSAAPVEAAAQRQGYLYVVLGGARYESIVAAVRGSYSLKMGLIVTATLLAVTLIIGAGLFGALTLPLRRLAERMRAWSSKMEVEGSQTARPTDRRDEIGALAQQFDRMADRIERQVNEIRASDAQRRDLIAGISHDLRTPLAALHGYLETVLLKSEGLSPQVRRQYLEVALRHSEHLQGLTAALFELSKLEAQAVMPRMEPFSLAELMQDVTLRFRLRAQQLGIVLNSDVDPHASHVKGDIALVERIFENLIDNALRHTPEGGTIRLSMQSSSHAMQVQVSDTGGGVSPQDLPHVFERFHRGEQSAGAGLGLAIVRRIVELHGQTVSIQNAPEQGATVKFALPFADRQPEQRPGSIAAA
jgi:two-component system OmpR family sensor kinase